MNNISASWPYFGEDEISAVERVLRSGKVNQWTGEEVRSFEKEYADYLGVKYAIALANGSLALDLALIVLGIGSGDEVIVSPRSFVASAGCIALRSATPVFADVDRDTQNITVGSVERVFTKRTKAVIAVHLAGWPCELDELRKFCDANKIFLIEDCAQAHGARYNGKPVGSVGHIAAFSFCQDKIMTTGGEGGLLVTNDKNLWEKAWSYKDHGKDHQLMFNGPKSKSFNWVVGSFGTNYRMTEMQAAIGRIMLQKLDGWVEKRRSLAQLYNNAFSNCNALRTTIPSPKFYHAYYKYYVFIRPENVRADWSRDRIIDELSGRGVLCGSGCCPEIYLEKPFREYCKERLVTAKELGETSIMLQVHPTLKESDISRVIEEVVRIMRVASK